MLISNVLDIWSLIDPKRIFVKPKLHLLLHLVFDIRDHGPAVLYATEIFECFNAIFRLCSVLSNHQAPSRDIALACADMDRFKHQVSGGWWRADQERVVQAGENVRKYFKNGELQRRLGYCDRSLTHPGMLLRARESIPLTRALTGTVHRKTSTSKLTTWAAVSSGEATISAKFLPQSEWYHCSYVVARTLDICKAGSWVIYECNVRPFLVS